MQHFSLPGSILKAAFFILLSTTLVAQNKLDSLSLKMDAIFKTYNRSNGPGCAVGIIRNGVVIFEKGYGIANLEYDIPITPATVFDIASVSKQFAGLAISTLVQEGKINLDDDIRNYLPEVAKVQQNHHRPASRASYEWRPGLAANAEFGGLALGRSFFV
jgi:CubicO group peptidase (beta-lactamase class C family)